MYDEDYYEGYDSQDFCDCSDYESDFEGRATCYGCGRSWWLTPEQMDAELRWQSEYDEQMCREIRQQERENRWSWFWEVYWRLRSWFTRKPVPSAHQFEADDDIPF